MRDKDCVVTSTKSQTLHMLPFEIFFRGGGTGIRSLWFLQRGSIACYAKRGTSHRILSDRLTVRPSVTVWHCVKTTEARIMGSSLTLVSSCFTAARNSKGNLGSEAAE